MSLKQEAREAQRSQSEEFWQAWSPEQVYEQAYIAGALAERERCEQIARTRSWWEDGIAREVAEGIAAEIGEQKSQTVTEDWEYGVSFLRDAERVFVATEDEWRAEVEVKRMNTGEPNPEENFVVRRRKAGPWEAAR